MITRFISMLTILAITIPCTVMSQKVSIQHAAGFGLLNAHRFQSFLYEYEFRLNYAFSNSSSVSLNLRPNIGLGINNDYRSAAFKDSIYKQPFYNDLVDVSVGYKALLSYNFGNAATRKAYKKFGGAIGVGYDVNVGTRKIDIDPAYDPTRVEIKGIYIEGKFNFPLGNTSWTLSNAYTFNTVRYNQDIKGAYYCALYYNFGVYIREKRRK